MAYSMKAFTIDEINAMTDQDFKVFENRLRRVAQRQHLRLEKCRTRDPRAVGYGTYRLADPSTKAVEVGDTNDGYGLDICEVHRLLTEGGEKVNDLLPWVDDDGGRADAGYRGAANDCVTRAIAIVTLRNYREVYGLLAKANEANGWERSARNGLSRDDYEPILNGWGWSYQQAPAGTYLQASDLPSGRIITLVEGLGINREFVDRRFNSHVAAVINGVLHDTYDSGRCWGKCRGECQDENRAERNPVRGWWYQSKVASA